MYRSPMHSSIYVIPHWVVESLARHGLKAGDILNYAKIRPILSMNDLISVEAAQNFGAQLTGMKRDFNNSIHYEWHCTVMSDKDKQVVAQIEPLSKDSSYRDAVNSRLFSEVQASRFERAYDVLPLEDVAIGLVVYPGFFTETKAPELHLSVLRDILKQLYVYEEHSTVAATSLYLRYLELLSQ